MPGRRFAADATEPPQRPADPAVRKAHLRRIFPLFRAYRPQLAVVFALIIFSAALGVIPSFLLKGVLDTAIPENDVRLLTALVAGMILIPIVTGAIGVYQTLLSNRVGQAVMHDLRTRSTGTCSGSRLPSSPAPARATCRAGSPTTSAGSTR